jgi:NDP-mannose synthase
MITRRPTQAIILAGGQGKRLLPYTTVLPKPLMPVGDRPILEILVRQLAKFGIEKIILATGHLHHLLQAYFGNGESFGLEIRYSKEDEAMGTAGPLSLVSDDLEEHFLIMNGDLLTTLNFTRFFQAHIDESADATIAVFRRTQKIDFGVLDIESDNSLGKYNEKPVYHFDVSMGINVLRRSAIQEIVKEPKYLDIPDLMMELQAQGCKVHCYREECIWLDIGRVEDYQDAHSVFQENREQFGVPE